jgi:hypothetical protein
MTTPINFIALPMRSIPLTDVGGAAVTASGYPYLASTEQGMALLLAAGMSASTVMPEAATERLALCMWLRTGTLTPPVDINGLPQEIQICLLSACTPGMSGSLPASGWSFSRIQRTDGVSDFLFSVFDGGVGEHYRFTGHNSHVWQFVVLHMVNTGRESIFSVHVDGQPLLRESSGSPAVLDGLDTDRILCVNCPQSAYYDGVISMPSAGDFIHDLFVTTDDIGDASFIYEDVSRLGVEAALLAGGNFIASVPLFASSQAGVVGVAETGAGKFAVDSDGSYYSLQDARFDVTRNLKLEEFPSDMIPYKTTSGSQFSISPDRGVLLIGSGLRLL